METSYYCKTQSLNATAKSFRQSRRATLGNETSYQECKV